MIPAISEPTTRIDSMQDVPNPTLDAETIRRMASEEVPLALSPPEVEALRSTLKGLLEEIGRVTLADRAGSEPETRVILEEWPR